MYMILLILAIGILVALQVVGYIKWQKGQISLRRFIGPLGIVIVILIPALSLPSNWTLGILVAAAIIFGIASFRDKRTQG